MNARGSLASADTNSLSETRLHAVPRLAAARINRQLNQAAGGSSRKNRYVNAGGRATPGEMSDRARTTVNAQTASDARTRPATGPSASRSATDDVAPWPGSVCATSKASPPSIAANSSCAATRMRWTVRVGWRTRQERARCSNARPCRWRDGARSPRRAVRSAPRRPRDVAGHGDILSGKWGARPSTEDEFVYLFQAKAPAAGHLSYPSPPLPEVFE